VSWDEVDPAHGLVEIEHTIVRITGVCLLRNGIKSPAASGPGGSRRSRSPCCADAISPRPAGVRYSATRPAYRRSGRRGRTRSCPAGCLRRPVSVEETRCRSWAWPGYEALTCWEAPPTGLEPV